MARYSVTRGRRRSASAFNYRGGARWGGILLLVSGLLVGGGGDRVAATAATEPTGDPGVAAAADDIQLDVVRHQLANGMTLLMVERHQAPVVSIMLRYKVGSADEHAGVIGAAHFVEHMLFKGTPTVGTTDYAREVEIEAAQDRIFAELRQARWAAGRLERRHGSAPDSLITRIAALAAEFDRLQVVEREVVLSEEISRIYQRHGAVDDNAGTGYDGTQYYMSLPANRLELWARLVSDQMENPVFREFYAERDVVIEERRRSVSTQPDMTLYEQVIGTAFLAHPYQILWEWESEVANITRAELFDFYRRYYAPNRALLALVGDFDPVATIELIERYFGNIPSQPDPEPVVVEEPEQLGERRLVVEFDAEPRLLMAWHKGAYDHPDEAAFQVLSQVLSRGRTSRFYRQLIDGKQVAQNIDIERFPGSAFLGAQYPEILMVYAEPRAPHTLDDLETAIDEEIARLRTEPVADHVLARVRNNIEADFVRGLESNLGLARQLVAFEAIAGDWSYIHAALDKVRGVTAADVMRAARTHLVDRNRTVGRLHRPAVAVAEETQP